MVEIEIDGKKLTVPAGMPVIEAANRIGTVIPHFCYHKKLSLAASCRMCLVEVEKMPRPVPACVTPATDGMVVHTRGEKAIAAQKSVMEFLLINHPLDCPICDQGGECRLQDIAVGYGATESRYQEEKRVVFHKHIGPLVSMEEMSRCIHCTRCVRFGQEIAGVMELGMLNRGEHAEITAFVGKTVDSELSGNMIDLCPVGALTSKPFRYQARSWELSRSHAISPHDGLGSNLIVQAKNNKVLRVLPQENESINECWISDRDRFSYEGLNSEQRLTKPMIKQGNQWHETDWESALDYIVHGLSDIHKDHGAEAIAALASPSATLEELALLKNIIKGLGSDNFTFEPRRTDFSLPGIVKPWLGMSIVEFGALQEVFVIGSFLRKDHPLLAARLRQAVKQSAHLSVLHAVDDDLLIPLSGKLLRAPSAWPRALAEVALAVAKSRGIAAPPGTEGISSSAEAQAIADGLLSGRRAAIFLGNAAAQHPKASELHTLAEWIAVNAGIGFGYLTEAANTVGAHLVGPGNTQAFDKQHKAYIMLHTEPEMDCANPQQAKAALAQAAMVISLSPFVHSLDVADVILPVSPFTETSGTFVNCEGRAQSFQASVRHLGESRPAWKVLRALGSLLELKGFDYDSSESVRDEITNCEADLSSRLNNISGKSLQGLSKAAPGLERIADIPIYFSDAIVRRAKSLQLTADAKTPRARMSPALMQQLGIENGARVRVRQDDGEAVLHAQADGRLAENVVRIAAAHRSTASLGAQFASLTLEKA